MGDHFVKLVLLVFPAPFGLIEITVRMRVACRLMEGKTHITEDIISYTATLSLCLHIFDGRRSLYIGVDRDKLRPNERS
jgi:hypothetical protein